MNKVFVNRVLNLKKIRFIGFDMDHTLIRYHTQNFEALVFELAINKLLAKNYPKKIKTFQFNFSDAIRGLVIDSKNGNILKLSRYGAIRQSYHGTRPIHFIEQKIFYRSIYVDLSDPNYMAIDTAFSIAFCVLYAQLVDLKDKFPNQLPSYGVIALDVQHCVDQVHSDGGLKSQISKNLEKYVVKDPLVVEGLARFLHYGKKLFILTNSEYYYTKLLLDYALNPFLSPKQTWQDLFEYVITLAAKPRFFYDNLRFLSINPNNGTMTNTSGKILPGIYQGGCANQFTEELQLNGDEILYIGDHIYGDILRLKKHCNWRTALVVEELGSEIASQKNAAPIEKKITLLMEIKKSLEQQYIDLCSHSIDEQSHAYSKEITTKQKEILTIDKKITELLQEEKSFYNPKWGRVFRAGAEESYFAYQVERFACIYMERISDLLSHSPLTYFRSYKRLLAHDIF